MAITAGNKRKWTVSTIPGPWSKADGLGGKVEVQRVRESPDGPKQAMKGDYEAGDVTLVRLYDAGRDADLVAQLRTGDMTPFDGATLTETAFDSAGLPIGRPIVLPNCVITSWELSGSDSNDPKSSELTIVWSVG